MNSTPYWTRTSHGLYQDSKSPNYQVPAVYMVHTILVGTDCTILGTKFCTCDREASAFRNSICVSSSLVFKLEGAPEPAGLRLILYGGS